MIYKLPVRELEIIYFAIEFILVQGQLGTCSFCVLKKVTILKK